MLACSLAQTGKRHETMQASKKGEDTSSQAKTTTSHKTLSYADLLEAVYLFSKGPYRYLSWRNIRVLQKLPDRHEYQQKWERVVLGKFEKEEMKDKKRLLNRWVGIASFEKAKTGVDTGCWCNLLRELDGGPDEQHAAFSTYLGAMDPGNAEKG